MVSLLDELARVVGYVALLLLALYSFVQIQKSHQHRELQRLIEDAHRSWMAMDSPLYEKWRWAVDFEGSRNTPFLAWFDAEPESFSSWFASLPERERKTATNHLLEHRSYEFLRRSDQLG